MAIKTALCTTLAEVFNIRNVVYPTLEPIASLNLSTTVEDRATCESNVQLQQLLPYLVARRHIAVGERNVEQFFMYRRGDKGGEAKLHDKLSIGLGGHVDVGPEFSDVTQQFRTSAALYRVLQSEAAREFKEECGVDIKPDDFDFTHFIIDPLRDTNEIPVAAVHLGLLSVTDVDSVVSKQMVGEESIVCDPTWVTLAQLMAPGTYERLETWSRLVVDVLYASNNLCINTASRAASRYQSTPRSVAVLNSYGSTRHVQRPTWCDECHEVQDVYTLPKRTTAMELARLSAAALAKILVEVPLHNSEVGYVATRETAKGSRITILCSGLAGQVLAKNSNEEIERLVSGSTLHQVFDLMYAMQKDVPDAAHLLRRLRLTLRTHFKLADTWHVVGDEASQYQDAAIALTNAFVRGTRAGVEQMQTTIDALLTDLNDGPSCNLLHGLKDVLASLYDPTVNVKAAACTLLDADLLTHRAQVADSVLNRFKILVEGNSDLDEAVKYLFAVVSEVKGGKPDHDDAAPDLSFSLAP